MSTWAIGLHAAEDHVIGRGRGEAILSRNRLIPPMGTVLVLVGLVACQSSGAGATSSSTATPSATAEPTPTSKPLTLPRPTDLPTDGSCEQGQVCLGLLEPNKAYTTREFTPHFTFSVPEPGWENISDEGGILQLWPIASPGDAIAFFRDPRATDADRAYAQGVGTSVDALATWLASNPLVVVTPAKRVTVGGLTGLTMDIRVATGTGLEGAADCPVQLCVGLFKGVDPSKFQAWKWDWGSAGRETQRLYLLTSAAGVVAIFVDSYDGTTFDSMTKAAGTILATVKFH
jgi:hypothetical protein